MPFLAILILLMITATVSSSIDTVSVDALTDDSGASMALARDVGDRTICLFIGL
jgi:hypothetical protein